MTASMLALIFGLVLSAVFSDNLVLVSQPVLVPFPEGSRVVDTEDINVLDFESSSLDLRDG